MTQELVRYDRNNNTIDFDIGDGLSVGIKERDFDSPLAMLTIVAWFASLPWCTLAHVQQLIELTKERTSWSVWEMKQP